MRPQKSLATFGDRGTKNHLLVATHQKNAARENFCRQPFSFFTLQQLLLSLTPVFILPEGTLVLKKRKKKDLRLIQLLSLVNAAGNTYFVLLQKQ